MKLSNIFKGSETRFLKQGGGCHCWNVSWGRLPSKAMTFPCRLCWCLQICPGYVFLSCCDQVSLPDRSLDEEAFHALTLHRAQPQSQALSTGLVLPLLYSDSLLYTLSSLTCFYLR